MKRSALALLLCLLFTSAGYAQQNPSDAPATKEDVNRFLDAMNTRTMMTSMMDMISKQSSRLVHEQVVKNPNLPPDTEARVDKMVADTYKNFPVDDLIQAMIPVYQKHFTKGDIDAFVAFYRSPAGQKLLKEMPAVTSESMQASMAIAQKMVSKTQQQIQDDIQQIQKDSTPAPKPQ